MADCKTCGGWFSSTAPSELCPTCERALKRLNGYVVSIGAHEQVRWERDVAMKQLEEHKIPFCGKAPDVVKVVRCKNCKRCEMCYPEKQLDKEATQAWLCKNYKRWTKPDDFCSYGERRDNDY